MSVFLGETYQDKNEAIAYTIDFAPDLDGATITSAAWNVSPDFTVESTSETGTTASIRISGGTSGKRYKIECNVPASDGQRLEGHFVVTVIN